MKCYDILHKNHYCDIGFNNLYFNIIFSSSGSIFKIKSDICQINLLYFKTIKNFYTNVLYNIQNYLF